MKRLTFGVSLSPFLATAALQRIVQDHAEEIIFAPNVEQTFTWMISYMSQTP